ncbi:NADH-quinone oxidoreductase subunit N [Sphingobacterium griseoflavum]|uniref:NADH-quinone oxidoreductase subunit N n=1 Tax=Sphingobacterium griseoflavum TaxID=1474952 RepID=A0ABQ3I0V1_9SPHI|nr:NADH-quinone oxidoreductase subunit N [Sphingobacterium griseoflavum]GHE43630.1 NADH-quinone oxidoreductase subunit N [Sphingobacterium griseoflavum]
MNVPITAILDQILASLPLFKPEFCLTAGFICAIATALFAEQRLKNVTFTVTALSLGATIYCLFLQVPISATTGFSGMWLVDKLGTYARILISTATLLIAFFIQQRHTRQQNGDIYSMLLAATLGMHVLCSTSSWLLAFIGIEMVSIASYLLVGYFSQNKAQSEAAMKYALFGSVCAAVMLYGLSLMYGLTGNLDFKSAQHLQGLMTASEPLVTLSILFVCVGIGFKLSFVPLHLWSPDVYQGSPTAITAFLSTVPKVGAIILFTRVYQAWSSTSFYFSELATWIIVVVALASMLIGNLAALRQKDVKRLMAYSSIAHTGFLMMAIFAYQDTFRYLFFYLVAYVLMNLATFIFIDHLEQRTGSTTLRSYMGLGRKLPLLFSAFTIVAVSLIGLPPTIGFIGKLMVFSAVFDSYQDGQDTSVLLLLVVGALTAVISLFFYFRIPLYAFIRKEDDFKHLQSSSAGLLLSVGYGLVFLVLLLGLFPQLLLDLLL